MVQSSSNSGMSQGVYRLEEPPVQEFCGGVDCYIADTQLTAILLFVGLLGFVALFALLYLKKAQTTCTTEIERVRSERDAFEQFARHVAELDPNQSPAAGTATGGPTIAATSNAGDGIREVRRLFSDTVMSVDHYDDEYGESLETHVAVELGDQVRSVISTDGQLTPNQQRAIVTNATEARKRRTLLADAIDTEHERLVEAEELLRDADDTVQTDRSTPVLERGFDDLAAGYQRLDERETDVEALVERRQERIHSGVAVPGQRWDGMEFCRYLYGSLPVQNPVLASAATVLDRLQTRKHRLATALSRRV